MWDDYFGWDWYAMRQFAFFALCLFGLASVIGMTEGYPWHQPLTSLDKSFMSMADADFILVPPREYFPSKTMAPKSFATKKRLPRWCHQRFHVCFARLFWRKYRKAKH